MAWKTNIREILLVSLVIVGFTTGLSYILHLVADQIEIEREEVFDQATLDFVDMMKRYHLKIETLGLDENIDKVLLLIETESIESEKAEVQAINGVLRAQGLQDQISWINPPVSDGYRIIASFQNECQILAQLYYQLRNAWLEKKFNDGDSYKKIYETVEGYWNDFCIAHNNTNNLLDALERKTIEIMNL
jgi:hypothetical protein